MTCKHFEFKAAVNVLRFENGRFMAEVRISCSECGVPMQFMGLEPGLKFNGATVSLDGLEANIAICPQGLQPTPFQKLNGHKNEDHN